MGHGSTCGQRKLSVTGATNPELVSMISTIIQEQTKPIKAITICELLKSKYGRDIPIRHVSMFMCNRLPWMKRVRKSKNNAWEYAVDPVKFYEASQHEYFSEYWDRVKPWSTIR
jgi:hypothetical protein